MTLNGWLQILFFFALILAVTKPLGVFHGARLQPRADFSRSRVAARRAADLSTDRRGRGARDALDGIRRGDAAVQRRLDGRALPDAAAAGVAAVQPGEARRTSSRSSSFNTAASFTTNTNWQSYVPEVTMSYLTQMAGLAYHNFVSAAVGIALAIAFIRGIARRETDTLGNFWVDMTRAALWVLLPFCLVGALRAGRRRRAAEPQALRRSPRSLIRRRWRRRTPTARQTTETSNRADDCAGAGRFAGIHQGMGHERRRLLQRQQRASV